MAELDYAFVAEYAKIEGGKLTAVGASYTNIHAPFFPVNHLLSVAGRIRAPEEVEEIRMLIGIIAPGAHSPSLEFRYNFTPGPDSDRYDGKVAVMFAALATPVFTEPGLCEIFIDIDDVRQRRLAFEIVGPS